MKLNMNCILCNIRQVLTVTAFTKSSPQEQQQAMREVLSYLATTEYNRSNPEVIRGTWEIITKHLQDKLTAGLPEGLTVVAKHREKNRW